MYNATTANEYAEMLNNPNMGLLESLFCWMFANFDPFWAVAGGIFLLHEGSYFGSYVPYLIADQIPSLRQYKIQSDKDNTFNLQWHCFLRLLAVHTVSQLPVIIGSHHLLELLEISTMPPFPNVWTTILPSVVFCYFVEDFYFYWIHRLLHWGPFYKYIHKVHHEHAAPFGIAGEYAHPIETVFLGIGTILGPLILRAHLLTLWVWLFFRVWQVIDCHSGYNFPWSVNRFVPFWGGAEFHDFHHMAFVGNFASTFKIWDKIFGTDDKYYQWKAKEAEKSSKLKAQ